MTTSSPEPGTARAELLAPAHWRAIEFFSDIHLHPSQPRTARAWRRQLLETDADAVFLLGDVFEVWVGDDVRDEPFERDCVGALAQAARQRPVYFMAGNRDFLFGPEAAQAAGLTRLADPTVLTAFGQRWLLSHGDALCLADADYLQFRAQVRSAGWQQAFLSRPLAERQRLARQMRDASSERQAAMAPDQWADVDDGEALRWLQAADAPVLIHGHTHRPATHRLADGRQRLVLADWHLDGPGVPRGDVLRLTSDGLVRLVPLALRQP